MLSGRVEAGCTTHIFATTGAGIVVEVVCFGIASDRVDQDFLDFVGITDEGVSSTCFSSWEECFRHFGEGPEGTTMLASAACKWVDIINVLDRGCGQLRKHQN